MHTLVVCSRVVETVGTSNISLSIGCRGGETGGGGGGGEDGGGGTEGGEKGG